MDSSTKFVAALIANGPLSFTSAQARQADVFSARLSLMQSYDPDTETWTFWLPPEVIATLPDHPAAQRQEEADA